MTTNTKNWMDKDAWDREAIKCLMQLVPEKWNLLDVWDREAITFLFYLDTLRECARASGLNVETPADGKLASFAEALVTSIAAHSRNERNAGRPDPVEAFGLSKTMLYFFEKYFHLAPTTRDAVSFVAFSCAMDKHYLNELLDKFPTEKLRARMGKDRADALLDNLTKNIVCLSTDTESYEYQPKKLGTFRALVPSSRSKEAPSRQLRKRVRRPKA